MADTSHLERMGRELKCPICLGLLDKAISLSCNHAFCNCCIEKSMKSASCCPVCKVPFRRREIRPAPHMDNLVNIYKSMKAASGANMFLSQADCPATSSGIEKPSFPAKKRVLVPQCPPGEMRSVESEEETPIITKGSANSLSMQYGNLALDKEGEPLFAPFFWLRECEDSQNSTQRTYEDQILETPPGAPSFSDIKDSDDEVPNDMPPEQVSERDVIGSEIFDWTQRPCSPELCSSPMHQFVQVGGTERLEKSRANKRGLMITGCNNISTNIPSPSSLNNITATETAGMSGKRTKSTVVKRRQTKRAKKIPTDASKATKELDILPEISTQMLGNNGAEPNVLMEASKNKKNISTDADIGRSNGKISSSHTGDTILIQDSKNLVIDLSNLLIANETSSENRARISGNITKKSITLNQPEVSSAHLAEMLPCDGDEGSDVGKILRRCRANHSERKEVSKSVRFPKNNSNGEVASKHVEKLEVNHVNSNKRDIGNSSGKEAFCQRIFCAFCQNTEVSEVSGVMLHYLKGKPVDADLMEGPNVVHCHSNCTEWAPNVFFEDDNAINLEAELRRSQKIRCALCGNRGAALGCFDRSCRKSFHVPCAKITPQFRWDYENFVVLCPLHSSGELPCEAPTIPFNKKRSFPERHSHIAIREVDKDQSKEKRLWKYKKNAKDFIICCSGLTNSEKDIISEFEKSAGITVLKNWDISVTHIVASTQDNGACKRTLKFLMGILEGKWIVNVEWVRACINSLKFVNEEPYEIKVDTHGIKDGPSLGRLRCLQKKPKLLDGYKFYLMGNFEQSYKGDLHNLVIAAGGTVLKRKPVKKDEDSSSAVFIVYNDGQGKTRCLDAQTLAVSTGAFAMSNSWLLDSIAGCKLQKFP